MGWAAVAGRAAWAWLGWAAELLGGEWVAPDPSEESPPLDVVGPRHPAPGLVEVWYSRQETPERPRLVALVGTLSEARGVAIRGGAGWYHVRTAEGREVGEILAVPAAEWLPGEG